MKRTNVTVKVKYPKGKYKLAQLIAPIVLEKYPFCRILIHRLTDKRGVHSTHVSVFIQHTHGVAWVVREKIVPALKNIDEAVSVCSKMA